jgi:ABC-type phosphate/phosphonate transport system permease subunit
VGAGGIGQELMTNIKLDRYDQVSITLLLIILVVRRWTCCPAVCASGCWRVENESLAGRTRCGASRQQHKTLYQAQGRYLRRLGLIALAGVLYYVWFFARFGIPPISTQRHHANWPLHPAYVCLA